VQGAFRVVAAGVGRLRPHLAQQTAAIAARSKRMMQAFVSFEFPPSELCGARLSAGGLTDHSRADTAVFRQSGDCPLPDACR
jgi:hypothetical protein